MRPRMRRRRVFQGVAILSLLLLSRDVHAERTGGALFEAGKVVFGVSYGATAAFGMPSALGGVGRLVAAPYVVARAVAGGCGESDFGEYVCDGQHGGMALVIPVVGPFLFTTLHVKDSFLNPNGSRYAWPVHVLAYTATAAQITGILLMLEGKSVDRHGRDRPEKGSLHVMPSISSGSIGVGMTGSF